MSHPFKNYVYSGNRLKENVGASYLVQEIYGAYLQEAVDKTFGRNIVDINAWRQKPGSILMREQENIPCEVGYIGGGNALLLFKYEGDEKCKAKELIQNWTLILLEKVPGLATAVAIKELTLKTLLITTNTKCQIYSKRWQKTRANTIPIPHFPNMALQRIVNIPVLLRKSFMKGLMMRSLGTSCVSKAKLKASEDSKDFSRRNSKMN